MKKKIIIAGVSGVIGRAVLEKFEADPKFAVVGLSRSSPNFDMATAHISVDLTDQDDCWRKLKQQTDVTHVAFASYVEKVSLHEQVGPNLTMLKNLIEILEEASPSLEHVTLFQGGKAYGCHLGAFKTPAKETDPRHMPPNFYYDQEDFLRSQSLGKLWSWTALRPEAVCGFAVGNPMNLLMVIAVYAAISKHLGQPMRFPGTHAAYGALYQVSDADVLASATHWAGNCKSAKEEIYNITNGDCFRWSTLWPIFAEYFDMEYAPPIPICLQDMMADKAEIWSEITREHGLNKYSFDQVASWRFGDFIFNCEFDNITSTIKARTSGFHDCIDSEKMFQQKFDRLRQMKVIP